MQRRYKEKDSCSGCGACILFCSSDALEMHMDEEGFFYPENTLRCSECGKCDKLCAFQRAQRNRTKFDEPIDFNREVYIGRHIDERVVSESRSGGIFTALSDYVFEHNGKVYGCVLDSELNAVHVCAKNGSERDRMRGSKYVQSIITSNSYEKIREYTHNGIMVFFTGTPCQVDAVKNYPGINTDNLITMDIVCHGVVSPKVWNMYRAYIEKITVGQCYDVDFRNKKKYGWREHIETLYIRKNGEDNQGIDTSAYRKIFYEHYALRPSCYRCPYKSQNRPGDITIGDCWGIESMDSKYDDDKGCSIILTNTDKGAEIFNKIKNVLDIKKTKMTDCLFQPGFHVSFQADQKKREDFWTKLNDNSDDLFASYS